MLILIGGLSGSGKTTLGRHLERHHAFRWIELDRRGPEAVDVSGFRNEWEAFLTGDPADLVGRFPGDTALTIPSYVPVRDQGDRNAALVRVRYLTGPHDKCFDRAHRRSGIDRLYWDEHNRDLIAFLEGETCPREWKIDVFGGDGEPRAVEDIAREVTA